MTLARLVGGNNSCTSGLQTAADLQGQTRSQMKAREAFFHLLSFFLLLLPFFSFLPRDGTAHLSKTGANETRDEVERGPNETRGTRQTLEGSFSTVSKPNFASKYAFESSRDLHNALLCTALKLHFFNKKKP